MQILFDDTSKLISDEECASAERGLMFELACFSNELETVRLSFERAEANSPNAQCICTATIEFASGRHVVGPSLIVHGKIWRTHLERRIRRLISRELGSQTGMGQMASES